MKTLGNWCCFDPLNSPEVDVRQTAEEGAKPKLGKRKKRAREEEVDDDRVPKDQKREERGEEEESDGEKGEESDSEKGEESDGESVEETAAAQGLGHEEEGVETVNESQNKAGEGEYLHYLSPNSTHFFNL